MLMGSVYITILVGQATFVAWVVANHWYSAVP